jgi:hypothetical protein
VPDQRLEAGSVADTHDDRVGRHTRAVGEQYVGTIEARDRRDPRPDPSHRVDEADVEDRDLVVPHDAV